MLEILLCLLILSIIATGAVYAAHYVVSLRYERDKYADELKTAKEYIADLEAQVIALEAQIENESMLKAKREDKSGWDEFNVRR